MVLNSEEDFLQEIQTAIEKNQLVLPTLPEVALKVREAVAGGNASDGELAKIISGDPALSARLLQVVNSPLYRAREKIENIQVAVTRMGHNTIRTLITSLAMQQIFKPKLPILDKYFHGVWKQSVDVSSMSRALAGSHCKQLDKEQAMLAGLIHQIGKLPILTMIEKSPEWLKEPAVFERLLRNLHPKVGKLIMNNWDMPEALSRAAWEYVDFKRDSGPQADYVDVVQVAFVQDEMITNPALILQTIDMKSFKKLGLDPEVEVVEIEGIADEVAAARSMFM